MIWKRTIVILFISKKTKTKFYNHLSNNIDFKDYLDGHAEKTIFLKFPTIPFRTEMMKTLKQVVPRFRIITANGQEQIKVL